jgi:hypothetical protein
VKPYNFNDWLNTAAKALAVAAAAHIEDEPSQFRGAIWGVLKEHLQDLFQRKMRLV